MIVSDTAPFTLAVCAEMAFRRLPMAERVKRIDALGFQVEIWDWTRHDIDALKATGATFSSMTGYVTGALGDEEGADDLLRTAERSIPVAHELGIPRLNLHGTGLDDRGLPVKAAQRVTGAMWMQAQRTLTRIADLGSRHGVTFVLENLNTAVDHPGVPFAKAEDTLALVKAVDRPEVRLMLDLYHAQIGEGNLIELLRRAAPYIGEIQVADVPGRCEPGTGEINYPAIARELEALGYTGTVGLEAWASGDDELALRRFREAFTVPAAKHRPAAEGAGGHTRHPDAAAASASRIIEPQVLAGGRPEAAIEAGAAPGSLRSETLHRERTTMIGFAILGCGRIGKMHARNIAEHPRAELVACYDVTAAAAEAIAREHGAKAMGSVEEALACPSVRAVFIASSTDTHAELIVRAVQAGKAVLCEKPIDLSMDRVEACWREIAPLRPLVAIGFNRRFDPSFKALRDRLQAGEIGKLEQAVITSRDPASPPAQYIATSGGLFLDMTIHDFDMARYLAGDIVEVQAMGANLVSPAIQEAGDIDAAMVVMRAASGALVHINNSRCAFGYDQRIEAFGEKGMLLAGNRHATTVEAWGAGQTHAQDPVLDFFVERYTEAYRAELDQFIGCVEQGAAPLAGFAEGREALRLADAALESLRTGRAVRVEPTAETQEAVA